MALAALLACTLPPAARATSAEIHGPVELRLDAQGRLCVHVRPGSPHEADAGWSVQWWADPKQPPLWERDFQAPEAARAWPREASRCLALPPRDLRTGQPYLIELSTIRLYRSTFCWAPAAQGPGGRLLAVAGGRGDSPGHCTTDDWVGQDGHALTTRGWWAAWRRWWRQWTD